MSESPKPGSPLPFACASCALSLMLGIAVASSRNQAQFVDGIVLYVLFLALTSFMLVLVFCYDKWRFNSIPPDALQRTTDDALVAELMRRGPLPMPDDAVDRRWLREIKAAFEAIPSFYYSGPDYPGQDPIRKVIGDTDRNAAVWKVQQLISSARAARGVRLPPVVTMKDD